MPQETKPKPILITHELSNLGRLNINLYGIAAEFYNQADSDGLIDYLKRLDHLGFISKSHPGNHHKRWDYVCLQLFLIQKLKHSAFNSGLNSSSIIEGHEISNQELLQFFILLANIGHLEGTISSEKALFDYLLHNSAVKSEFFVNINKHADLRLICEDVLNTNDYYKIKYLISLNYVLSKPSNSKSIAALKALIKFYLLGDEKVEKIRNIYFRVRRICFVYLDSYHCHTPIQLNISKILVNIFNYDELFNPVEHDYDKILDASETILTKQIYISPISSLTYKINYNAFLSYLATYTIGKTKIDYSNFLISLSKRRKEKFELQFADAKKTWALQFYITKDSLKILETSANQDFDNLINYLFIEETRLQSILTDRVNKNCASIVPQYDMRRTLLFFTIIIKKDLSNAQLKILIGNFSFTVHEIITGFKIPTPNLLEAVKIELIRSFRNDLIRRHFLYILKILLEKENRLNLYVKFQYKQEQNKINKSKYLSRLYEANYSQGKMEFIKSIDSLLTLSLPADILNNLNLLKEIASNHSSFKTESQYYYTVLPIEVEEKIFDPGDVDKTGNSESKNIITDIDALLLILNGRKYELFIIEGKDLATGFRTACAADLKRIKSLSSYSNIINDPVIISVTKAKGGFLAIKG
jgi:hypothetical protein